MKTKKRFVLIALFAVFFIFNCFSVYALGIGPAKTELDFQPNYEFSVDYMVVGIPPEQKLEVYAKGDLVEYVEFDKTNLTGEENFKASVKLPPDIEKPGPNKLYIGVREIKEGRGGIGARVAVEALIVVYVPYPGKYAEISFSVNNVNVGEPINFVVEVNNLGKEDITVKTDIEVYSAKNLIETLNLGSKFIKTQTKEIFTKQLNSSGYKAGKYKAIAIVDYGKIIKEEKEFKIGTLFVNITNWTSEVRKGKINKFDIWIESFWNSGIDNIYANVNITSNGESFDFFKTPSVSLKPWQKMMLQGYFNTEELDVGNYKANIILFYDGKTTKKTVDIKVISSIKIIILYIIVVLVIVVAAIALYFFWKKYGKEIIRKREKSKARKEK